MTAASDNAILSAASRWTGTPYRHQASVRGAGCDCLGLLRGIWREVIGPEPEAPPPYAPVAAPADEGLHAAALRWLTPVPEGHAMPGDVLLFRMQRGGPARHLGILAPGDRMIHAWEALGVVEIPLTPAWRRRRIGVFRFPAP